MSKLSSVDAHQSDNNESITFQELPTDAILAICRFCDIRSLLALSQTCRRVNEIIKDDFVWLKRSRAVNASNQVSSEIKSRSFYILPCKERCRISCNWNSGRFKENIYLSQKTKFMPWLRLECRCLWLSRGNCIYSLERKKYSVKRKFSKVITTDHKDDVSRFVVKNETIVSGGRDGSICAWNTRTFRRLFQETNAHVSDISDVDYHLANQIIVTGGRDELVKVWNIAENGIQSSLSLSLGDRVWTVALEPSDGRVICCGSSGHNKTSALALYDLQKCQINFLRGDGRYGAGVLHVLWEDPQTFLSCGYDGIVRMWDIRSAQCVNMWIDPHDAALYCLASDHTYTILCGTAQHGRVQMWDKRHSRNLQMYFMNSDHSSPVYSAVFDPTHLFVALDQSLNMMDFSGFKNSAIDYR